MSQVSQSLGSRLLINSTNEKSEADRKSNGQYLSLCTQAEFEEGTHQELHRSESFLKIEHMENEWGQEGPLWVPIIFWVILSFFKVREMWTRYEEKESLKEREDVPWLGAQPWTAPMWGNCLNCDLDTAQVKGEVTQGTILTFLLSTIDSHWSHTHCRPIQISVFLTFEPDEALSASYTLPHSVFLGLGSCSVRLPSCFSCRESSLSSSTSDRHLLPLTPGSLPNPRCVRILLTVCGRLGFVYFQWKSWGRNWAQEGLFFIYTQLYWSEATKAGQRGIGPPWDWA